MTRLSVALGLSALAVAISVGPAWAQPRMEHRSQSASEASPFRTRSTSSQAAIKAVPFDSLSPQVRDRVKKVMLQPTLVTNTPVDEFKAAPSVYTWLLDHPDRTSLAWQRLNVQCTPIIDRGNGRFGWSDGEGSDISWATVYNNGAIRVWYAEGVINPGRLLPNVPVKAVVVVRHQLPATGNQVATVRHQADVFLHTDSRAANLAARMFGPSADRMAQEAAEQLMMFFSGIAKHLANRPESAEKLLAPGRTVRANAAQ